MAGILPRTPPVGADRPRLAQIAGRIVLGLGLDLQDQAVDAADPHLRAGRDRVAEGRPRHIAPFTYTGPSGASRPRASPTRPISPRWVATIRSRDCIATVSPNP